MTTITASVTCILWNIPQHYDCYASCHLHGPDKISLKGCDSAITVDCKENNEGICFPHHYAAATSTSVPDAFSGICQLHHACSTGKFLFQRWVYQWFLFYVFGICCDVELSAFRSMWLSCSPMGAQPLGFVTLQPFRVYPLQAYMPSDEGLWLTPGVHWVAVPPATLNRGSFLLLIQQSLSYSSNMVGHRALGAW